ncbi:TRAP transporter substrate-binding protein DctP [Chloroflexota bacterium]
MKNKRLFALVGSILLILVLTLPFLAACSEPAPTPAPTPAPAPAPAPTFTPQVIKSLYMGSEMGAMNTLVLKPYYEAVTAATGGRVVFEEHYGMTLLAPPNFYDGVTQGVVELAYMPTAYNPGRFRRTEMLSLPNMYPDRVTGWKIFNDVLKEAAYKDFSEVHAIYLDCSGPRQIWTTTKPMRTLDDLKGLRIRHVTVVQQKALEILGAVPTSIKKGEQYVALERGLLDGSLEQGSTVDPFGFQDVLHYATNINFGGVGTMIAYNKGAWEKLGPDIQGIMEKLHEDWMIEGFAEVEMAQDMEMQQKFVSELGLEVIDLSAEDLAKWNAIVAPMYQEWATVLDSEGKDGTEMLNAIRKAQEKHGVTIK